MKTSLIAKMIKYAFICILMLVIASAAQPSYAAPTMSNYCLLPPYVKTSADPNVLIMMDNATDMGEQAYTDNYDPSKTYSGYFKPTLKYSYSSNRFLLSRAEFIPGTS